MSTHRIKQTGGKGATPNHQPAAAAGEVEQSLPVLRDPFMTRTCAEWQAYQEELMIEREERKAVIKHQLIESRRVLAYADRVLEQTK
jgi:hypothetical protein